MQTTDTGKRMQERQLQNEAIAESLSKIKTKLLVMSGKGGVGKSSIAVNIAAGLAKLGCRVGLMDVDLHGPSIPQMLGIPSMHEPGIAQRRDNPKQGMLFKNGTIIPARFSGTLSVVSIEPMIESADSAVIWRGPLKISAIRQFISDVAWEQLDYLVIDSPPGTGDEPLTIAQTIEDAQAIIVTTPQKVSLRDVRKSIHFCRRVNMPICGLIENMSGFVCPHCGKNIDVFKTGAGEQTAKEMNLPFLGKIPIVPAMVDACDSGVPGIETSETLQKLFQQIISNITGDKDFRLSSSSSSSSSSS